MPEMGEGSRIRDPDEIYSRLMEATRDLDPEATLRFCARLVLLLAQEIGDDERIGRAIRLARDSDSRRAELGAAAGASPSLSCRPGP
ncbi:hypothetical protein HRbin40_02600 [bacterium HR40]|nr:hypothetical protein HRbin40_02600 [bacterium HR40]